MLNFPPLIKKRNGELEEFNLEKIIIAITNAASDAGYNDDPVVIKALASKAGEKLHEQFTSKDIIPGVDDSNSVIVEVLKKENFKATAALFESHAKKREKIRDTLSIHKKVSNGSLTDQMLLISSVSGETYQGWDRSKISNSLQKEYNLAQETAKRISKKVENSVFDLIKATGNKRLSTAMIRKIAEVHLMQQGLTPKNGIISIPKSTLESLVLSTSHENSNITSNNPEAVNLGIAEYILKQYNLENIFSQEVADGHNSGAIHLHDLGYPQRVYCSSHSIEYIKKYGLNKVTANLQNKSSPPKSAMVLNGHIQTFLASMQANYAGALGFGFLNIFYAPMLNLPQDFVEGELNGKKVSIKKDTLEELVESGIICMDGGSMDENDKNYFKKTGERKRLYCVSQKKMRQVAQNLIFSGSQNAFSRGGQTLFIDFNIHAGVPDYLKNVPALGPGGKYMIEDSEGNIEFVDNVERFEGEGSRKGDAVQPEDGKRVITYGDPRMVETSQKFAVELMKVWEEGDKNGVQFAFPKCDVHVDKNTFNNPDEYQVFKEACKLASKNGSTYFMFDRQSSGATLAQCCRLKERVTDPEILKYPEKIRFTGFQNVTINLPQAAYRSKEGLEGMLKNMDKSMELAVKAHLQKRDYIQRLLDTDGSPLRSLGMPSDDGKPYVDLKSSTYIIGLIGLNEAVQYLTGKELHESREAYETGLKIIDRMNQNIQKFKQGYGLKFTLEESPAESATQKLSKSDLNRYPESKKVIKGNLEKAPFYTNSVHLNPGADVSILDRIELQSKFHDMIESGAIIHVYCGEHQIPAESIEELVKKAYENTRATQITISPEFTHCNGCHSNYFGFKDKCGKCDSGDVTFRTKIVGYFSNLNVWNDSQLQISEARRKVADKYADFSAGINWLYEKDGSRKVMIFGKSDCDICSETKTALDKVIKEKNIDAPIEFYDLTKSESRILAAMNNVPLDTIPTVVCKNNGETIKYELEFKNGKPLHRREADYARMIEKSFK
jgi:ribonucleoside-triphosphate reductase